MSLTAKLLSAIRTFWRHIFFNLMWLLPTLGLAYWHRGFLEYLLKAETWRSVTGILLVAITWWLISWVLYITAQVLWPLLMLIFFKTERERNPKRIISIGERFRKMDLSSPQIFVLKENLVFWKNRVWGFFVLPSPLGALLLIEDSLSEQLTPEEYDLWMCRQVIEARFYRFTAPAFLMLSQGPAFVLLSYALGLWLGAGIIGAIVGGTIFIYALWYLLRQRWISIDNKTMHDFNFTPEFYFETFQKIAGIGHSSLPNLLFLRPSVKMRSQKAGWFRTWPALLFCPLLSALLIITNFITTPSAEIHRSWVAFSGPAEIEKVKKMASAEPAPLKKVAPVVAPPAAKAISLAVMSGDMRAVIRAIGQGEKLHSGDPAFNGATALLLAVREGDLEMVYVLLSMGSSLRDEVDNEGQGVLFYALQAPNREQVIAYLLNAHIDLNQKSREGLTAYDMAVKNGFKAAAALLAQFKERQGSAAP